MTIEDFAHRCLLIKAGNAELAIPCCANCDHYKKSKFMFDRWSCQRTKHLEHYMNPEDFCSRFTERENENE